MTKKRINIGFLKLGEFTSDFYLKQIERLSIESNKSYKITELEVDFEKWNEQLPYGFEELEPKLKKILTQLNTPNLDCIVIPNVTLHFTLDRLDLHQELRKKIIHPIKETVAYLNKKRITEITLIGTRFTMNSDLMNTYFKESQISLKMLNSNKINEIDKLRTEVFETGFTKRIEKKFDELIYNIENPVLACTELSIINEKNKIIDFSGIQLNKIFNK